MQANLAVKLDPSLKHQQTEAMTNDNLFSPEIPPFEVYKMKLNYQHNKDKVSTNVPASSALQGKLISLKNSFCN